MCRKCTFFSKIKIYKTQPNPDTELFVCICSTGHKTVPLESPFLDQYSVAIPLGFYFFVQFNFYMQDAWKSTGKWKIPTNFRFYDSKSFRSPPTKEFSFGRIFSSFLVEKQMPQGKCNFVNCFVTFHMYKTEEVLTPSQNVLFKLGSQWEMKHFYQHTMSNITWVLTSWYAKNPASFVKYPGSPAPSTASPISCLFLSDNLKQRPYAGIPRTIFSLATPAATSAGTVFS